MKWILAAFVLAMGTYVAALEHETFGIIGADHQTSATSGRHQHDSRGG